ncbi:TlpA disulfide reductase family protein [uncultured Rhodoblastus sp.]|uniref:thiol:disulfide interchange protein TlpA n=1 Tax=uncultured Rhodoblastus sp. TaxID=543037 RepID=UPI0025F5EFB0|nr:TlpA disulfide reductase family protein [uncultured Rhodoblastus sp.]
MNDAPDSPPTASPEQMRAIARRLILPPLAFAAVAVVAVLWFVLYGMNGGGGKEAASGGTGECAASAALAPQLAPLAKGDIAALAIDAQPKLMPALGFARDGKPVDLASFRGKIVLLNLWATWCVPCREEMPALDRLQGIAGDKDFSVVAVNIDTARLERPKGFLQEIGVKNLTFFSDSSAKAFQTLQQSGKVVGLPTSFLLGRDGCALGVLAGPAKWDGADALALIKAATQQ